MASRTSTITRTTKETDISLTLEIDGTGKTDIDTGIPFFDQMCIRDRCIPIARVVQRRYMSWIAAALLAALCAGITSILAKCGMRDTDSDIATGIRTAVVLVFAWLVVFVTDAQAGIGNITPLSWIFLIASGAVTGASWLCYFKALSLGDVNKVVPVDKSSAAMAALLAIVLFGETSNLAVKLISIVLITVGTYLCLLYTSVTKRASAFRGRSVRAFLEAEACSALVFS